MKFSLSGQIEYRIRISVVCVFINSTLVLKMTTPSVGLKRKRSKFSKNITQTQPAVLDALEQVIHEGEITNVAVAGDFIAEHIGTRARTYVSRWSEKPELDAELEHGTIQAAIAASFVQPFRTFKRYFMRTFRNKCKEQNPRTIWDFKDTIENSLSGKNKNPRALRRSVREAFEQHVVYHEHFEDFLEQATICVAAIVALEGLCDPEWDAEKTHALVEYLFSGAEESASLALFSVYDDYGESLN